MSCQITSNLADLMAHQEGTAEKYYRVFEKNKSSVKASKKLHGVMRNCEKNKKKSWEQERKSMSSVNMNS